MRFYLQYWFLCWLVLLIAVGMTLGWQAAPVVSQIAGYLNTQWITGVILVLMSFTLESAALVRSFRAPGPVMLACVVNIGLAPILALLLFPLQAGLDLQFGLMVAGAVPCTVAAATVWTRKAGGNDAVSLLTTIVTNLACIVVSPFWLSLAGQLLGRLGGAGEVAELASRGGLLDPRATMEMLFFSVILPILAGQSLRQIPALARLADRNKLLLGMLAQILILSTVWTAASRAGISLGRAQGVPPTAWGLLVAWLSCLAIHVISLQTGAWLSRVCRFSEGDCAAVAFAGSQKTLPVGILLAQALAESGGLHFAVFPMLMYHATQLIVDAGIAERWGRAAERRSRL